MRAVVAAVVVAAMVAAGCSSAYTPRPGRRLSVMVKSGKVVYVRDGQTIPAGSFGNGLRKAVAGNRQAEAAAETYHDGVVRGTIGAAVSGVCLGVELYRVSQYADDPDKDFGGIDAGLVACSVVAYVYAIYELSTAIPYLYDAINIYNDSVDGFVPRPPAGGEWLPPAGPASPVPTAPTAPTPSAPPTAP